MRFNHEIIADDLSKAGWSWGCVATNDRKGRTIFVADAHRDDGKRFVVHAEKELTANRRSALAPIFYLTCRGNFPETRSRASTFTATTRPVRAYQLFSIPVRSDCHVSCAPMPGQLNIRDGVVLICLPFA
jgi:hypothetical protein